MRTNMSRSPESINIVHANESSSACGRVRSSIAFTVTTLAIVLCLSTTGYAQRFQQNNLVSDVPGMAPTTDPNLVNPWGLARSATSPWWVADNGRGVSTLYTGAGAIVPLVVTIPVPPGGTPPSKPTGAVFNGGSDFFGDRFIFVTEEGVIAGWSSGTAAVLRKNNNGTAIYKGVTIAQNNGVNLLYAANFFGAKVEVYDGTYTAVSLGSSAFTDPFLPAGYAPFNVQNINGQVWVTFALQDEDKEDEVDGPGLGFVDLFDAGGNLLLRLQSGSWMNAPWGVAAAPPGFFGPPPGGGGIGGFAVNNTILVGQFGGGQIAQFDLKTGAFHGFLLDTTSQPLTIDGLWALGFGNGGNAGSTNTLFFTAGIGGEMHGLFGTITPVP